MRRLRGPIALFFSALGLFPTMPLEPFEITSGNRLSWGTAIEDGLACHLVLTESSSVILHEDVRNLFTRPVFHQAACAGSISIATIAGGTSLVSPQFQQGYTPPGQL